MPRQTLQLVHHVHGDAGGDAPQRVGQPPVHRHLYPAGTPRVVCRHTGVRVGEVRYRHRLLVGVHLRRVRPQLPQGQQERVRHLLRRRAHGRHRRRVDLAQHRAQQAARPDVQEVHLTDDGHGALRDAQLLPRLPQGALDGRLARFPLAAGEADLARLTYRGGAYLVQQAVFPVLANQRHQHRRAAPFAHQRGGVTLVGRTQSGNVHIAPLSPAKRAVLRMFLQEKAPAEGRGHSYCASLSAAAPAAAVVAAAAAVAAAAVAAEQEQQDDRNDDPAAAAAAKAGILITHIVTSYENLTAVRSHSHSMPPQEKCSSGLGDTIAECQQGVHKVDVLEENAVLLGGQLHVGEVPEAPDAQTDQPVGQRLRHALRHGQHRHVGMVAGHIVLQLVHGVDGHAADLRSDQRRGDIEGGVDAEAHLFKIEVLQQRMTKMPHADDDDAVPAVDAENVADLRPQLCHVIAVSLLPELTEAAEILPDLRGGDVHFSAQRIGADAHHALVVQVV